jgi:hypothetical protein
MECQLQTNPHIRSANGRLSIMARLSRPSEERDAPFMKEACGHEQVIQLKIINKLTTS